MAINYPTSLDSLTNPVGTDPLNAPSHSQQHRDANDAVEALEAKVGVNSSAVTTSHDYKLSNVTGSDKAMSLTGTETGTNKRFNNPRINSTTVVTADGAELNILDGATLSTAELNILDGVTATTAELNHLAGNGGITGSNLSTSAIKLGYAAITSDFTTASTTLVQVTGLTLTITVPAGGRSVKLTVWADSTENTNANMYTQIAIFDGTVAGGTMIARATNRNAINAQPIACVCIAFVTPSAGSKTYNVGFSNAGGSGTAKITAASTHPAFLLAELI